MPALLDAPATVSMLLSTPLGKICLASDGTALMELWLPSKVDEKVTVSGEPDEVLRETARQLKAYFAGELREFDVPMNLTGTSFQKKVWDELTRIPYGETISYAELATRIGNPKACRAVGLANGRNPIAILVPCHRVIGANGTLTGYGGGLPTKQWLLEHEQRFGTGG